MKKRMFVCIELRSEKLSLVAVDLLLDTTTTKPSRSVFAPTSVNRESMTQYQTGGMFHVNQPCLIYLRGRRSRIASLPAYGQMGLLHGTKDEYAAGKVRLQLISGVVF